MRRVAVAAAGVCLVIGLACQRGEQGRSKPAAAAVDTGAGERASAAIAAETGCSSFLDLELPKAASSQMQQSIQRCAATVPTPKGVESAHLRIRIEASGRVRDVKPFDPAADPISAPLLGCIEAASRAWTIPHDKNQCIEVAPTFGLIPIDILVPGYHHVDDLRADFRTSPWWALCQDDDGPAARPVRWSASRIRGDSCFGDEARMVKVQGCRKPVFLARGLAIPTRRLLAADHDSGSAVLKGHFAGQSWQVEIVGGDHTDAFLIAGGRRQWLFELGGDRVDVPWAGDLDGDGRLDLFIQNDDESPSFYLFLSSAARPGEVVHAVAKGFSSSC